MFFSSFNEMHFWLDKICFQNPFNGIHKSVRIDLLMIIFSAHVDVKLTCNNFLKSFPIVTHL